MSRSKSIITASTFLSIALISGLSVLAQTDPNSTPGSSNPSPSVSPSVSVPGTGSANSVLNNLRNEVVLNFIHHVNSSEVNEANEALARLENQQAISYAQTMISDHQLSDQQIDQIAAQKGLTIYAFQPSTVEIATSAQLDQLVGQDFDLAYLQVQLNQHQRALQDLQLLQTQVNDPDIQSLISSTLPAIQNHIALANAAINGFSNSSASPSPGVSSSPSVQPSASPSPGASPSPNGEQPSATPSPRSSP